MSNQEHDNNEQVRPFVIDHEAASKMQKATMVLTQSEGKKSVADDLIVSEAEEKQPKKKSQKQPKVKIQSEEKKIPEEKSTLQRMFNILPPGSKDPNRKLYLLLLVITGTKDNEEDEHTFKFIHGRQEVYDFIKKDLEAGVEIDCMKSLIIVDSSRVPISKGVPVYTFMKDAKDRETVIDVSSFDIQDYYYELPDEDKEQY